MDKRDSIITAITAERDQYRRDSAAHTDRAAELAARVSEVERERDAASGLWLLYAVRRLHSFVDQTDPNDVIGVALTRAGLERCP